MNNANLMAGILALIAIASAFLVGCGVGPSETGEDTVELKLGHYLLEVPKKNVMSSNTIPNWLRWLPGLDDGSKSMLFRFTDREIKQNVPGYRFDEDKRFRDDIEILVMVLTPEEVARYRDSETYSELGKLWRGEGSYKDRKLEPYGETGWYKVYRGLEYPNIWALLNRYPDSSKPLPRDPLKFLVAHCVDSKPKNGRLASCGTYELLGDIVIEFSVSDYNISVIDDVRKFFRSTVQGWIKRGKNTHSS